MPPALFMRLLGSSGVMITTPITLRNRAALFGEKAIADLDCVIFDEIDTYLTVDELDRKQDVGPALDLCLDAGAPILGFTGTHLTAAQLRAWQTSDFVELQLEVPQSWMPFTPTKFIPIKDPLVSAADDAISDEIGAAYGALCHQLGMHEGCSITWSEVKDLARSGYAAAITILRLMTERLLLFESPGSNGLKYRAVIEAVQQEGPTLVLTRYIHTAQALAEAISEAGIDTVQVDGEMSHIDIEQRTAYFRERRREDACALVLTRDLGGRGLDFPSASRAILVSPRSNHQTVAQELARIRSRNSDPKTALIYYFDETEEAAKGHRLGAALRADRYGGYHLFDVQTLPPKVELKKFESRNLRNEESLVPQNAP